MTIERWITALLAVIAGWIGLLMLVMVTSDAAPGALVLFPPADFIASMPPDIAVVGIGPHWITVSSGHPGLGRALYAAGARIVLPAGLQGCLPLI